MNSRTFGGVLENLLYISKQKKSSLASYLGYDVSYINKWINSKNLPSVKRAAEICDNISKFIIESLDDDSKKHLIEYFELDNDGNDFLYEYIKDTLQEIYFEDFMPYGLVLKESNDFDTRINNVISFHSWCASRLILRDRTLCKGNPQQHWRIPECYGSGACTDCAFVPLTVSAGCVLGKRRK